MAAGKNAFFCLNMALVELEGIRMSTVKIHRKTMAVNGINLFYMDTETLGEPIVCLHGRWGRAETWVDFMQHYGSKYRVIAPDQRGHGLSSKPVSKYTADEMAADILALMDTLKLEKVILVGHSMGGHIAGYLASVYPERFKALAILDKSAAGPEKQNTAALDDILVVDPVTKDWPLPFSSLKEARDYIKKVMESELSYQYFMNSLIEKEDGYHMMFSVQAMAANIAYYAQWFDLLPAYQCPVLLIRASGEGAVTDQDFDRMRSLIPDCMAFTMSHPDHNVQLANKEEFYGCFDQFLIKVEK
jgi:2-succinyl-6-hydroxy-2,4-cyclohexadiene-1-carboxylate synthase